MGWSLPVHDGTLVKQDLEACLGRAVNHRPNCAFQEPTLASGRLPRG